MESIEEVSEKLASAVVLRELAESAVEKAGFVKLADNEWLAPLVGAGLGAAGGGLAGYLSSPDVEKEHQARKRMLIGALTGGGMGGLAGYGLNRVGETNKETGYSRTPNKPPSGKLPWFGDDNTESRAGAIWKGISHPYRDIALAAAGGVGDVSTHAPKTMLGGLGHWVGSKFDDPVKIQRQILDKYKDMLVSGNRHAIKALEGKGILPEGTFAGETLGPVFDEAKRKAGLSAEWLADGGKRAPKVTNKDVFNAFSQDIGNPHEHSLLDAAMSMGKAVKEKAKDGAKDIAPVVSNEANDIGKSIPVRTMGNIVGKGTRYGLRGMALADPVMSALGGLTVDPGQAIKSILMR